MLKCLSWRSDQKIELFGIGHARQFMFIFATIFFQSTIFCGAVNNVIAVDYNNVFPVKYGIHR